MGLLKIIPLVIRSRRALDYASERGLPSMEIAELGRRVGWRVAWQAPRLGLGLVVTPINCTRYFEFAYALEALPESGASYLDVSSPRMFSVYVASRRPGVHIEIANPDLSDLAATKQLVKAQRLTNVSLRRSSIAELGESRSTFNCIWSISVIEHIAGERQDGESIRSLFGLLSLGGRLIVTVPVAPRHKDEYRDVDYYGQQEQSRDGYFFQRYYDENSLEDRLFAYCAERPQKIRWFGEREPGWFDRYEARWMQGGHHTSCDDPRLMVDNFREYERWADMPGKGVCCFTITRAC